MLIRRSLLLIPAVALVAQVAQAQPSTTRFPWPPTYGLGLPFLNDNAHSLRTLGMGVGMAMYAPQFINDYNQALLPSSAQNLMIEGDFSFWSHGRTYLEGGSRSVPMSKFRVPNLRVSYPLLGGSLTLRAAYQAPRIYSFDTRETFDLGQRVGLPKPDLLTRTATGASKIRQYSLGAGFTMIPNLSGGVQVDYLTGTYSATSATVLTRADTAALGARWNDGGKVTSWRMTGSLFHRFPLTRTLILGSGLSATYSLPLKTKSGLAAEGLSRLYPRATTRIPLLVKGGLSVGDDVKWRVGTDASWQRWSAYRSWNGVAKYPDAFSVAVGGELTPGGIDAPEYFKRSTYRAGLSYGRQIREELPRTVTEMALSAGASFPITRIEEKRRSYLNLALRFGRAIYPEANVYKGGFFEIGAGITFNSRLYIQVGRGNCPIPSCHVRKKHLHDGAEYRGQPWYKMQNPHIGEKLPYRRSTEKPRSNDKKRFRF